MVVGDEIGGRETPWLAGMWLFKLLLSCVDGSVVLLPFHRVAFNERLRGIYIQYRQE